MALTEEQIVSLAPDTSSLKSGKELAVLSKWQLQGANEKALWGLCQGSGKIPYQTQIDLQNIAFKCSCPSRKFPCKHGLGLLLLYHRESGSFTNHTEPEWVSEWLSKRTEKNNKPAVTEPKPVDAEAQLKRAEARSKKVSGGISDLQGWLNDLVRNGILSLPEHSHNYWVNMSKRLIDAQAPGLANMVKGLGDINYFEDSWKYKVLDQLSRLNLICEAYKRLDALPDEFQQEIKSLVGFTINKDEILAKDGLSDQWTVLARTIETDEQLTIERNWLYGKNQQRFALIIQFFANRQLPEMSFMPGTTFDGELVFYNGIYPYRALVKKQNNYCASSSLTFSATLSDAYQSVKNAVTENPFLEKVPLLLSDVRISPWQNQYFLWDKEKMAIRINATEPVLHQLLAVTGGKPCQLFGLYGTDDFEPLAVWVDQQLISLNHGIQ